MKTQLLYHDDPDEALRQYARDEDIELTVVATHGHTGLSHFFLGSFAEKIVRASAVPVLTFHAEAAKPCSFEPTTVLVAIDFSENSHAVLRIVRFPGAKTDASFVFCHVVEPIPTNFNSGSGRLVEALHREMESAPDRARVAFDELKAMEFPELDARFETLTGRPQVGIVAMAKQAEASLVIMATHGWTELKHQLLGSVAERVVQRAPWSVLTLWS